MIKENKVGSHESLFNKENIQFQRIVFQVQVLSKYSYYTTIYIKQYLKYDVVMILTQL